MSRIIKDTVRVSKDRTRLYFRVSCGNGDYIKFPIQSKTSRVIVSIPNYYDGVTVVSSQVTKEAVCDRNGFTISKIAYSEGTPPYFDTRIDPVDVIVEGEF